MATKTKPKMTEQQFIAKYKKAGFEFYKTEDIKKRLDTFEADLQAAQDKLTNQCQKTTGLSKVQFTKQMFKEIKEIAAAGFHYQAFVLLGVFLKHLAKEYGCKFGLMPLESELAEGVVCATETYKPGAQIKFSDSNHMKLSKSGARILGINETLAEVEQRIQPILKDDFLSFE